MDESNGNGDKASIHDFSNIYEHNFYDAAIQINFLPEGKEAAKFYWEDIRTLSQIEQMTGFKVKPRGVVLQFNHGGFVVYEENGHGLVAALADFEEMDWHSSKTACDELILNGYSDWYLPTKDEFNSIYVNLGQFGVGGFVPFRNAFHWSGSVEDEGEESEEMWVDEIGYGTSHNSWRHSGELRDPSIQDYIYVRAVRAF
jgi:hypothetical protein